MKLNPWTFGLIGAGLVSLPAMTQADEKASSVMTALSATTISGYVNTSAIWEPGTGTASIPGRAFDGPASKHDGFNLDVVSLTVAKPVAEGDWGAGYMFQMWAGPDAVGFNTAFPNGAADGGDFAVKQAFVDLQAPVGNGLTLRLGHFNYIGGYEMPDAGDNPNYSRSYAWTLEPASHTGALLMYKVCEGFSVMGGVANTYNNGINWRGARFGGVDDDGNTIVKPSETEKTYMAQMAFTAPTNWGVLSGATLTTTVVNGLNNASGDAGSVLSTGHITCWQIGGTMPTPLTGLAVGISYDYMDGAPLAFAPETPSQSKYANAVTGYLMYQATEKLKLNGRAEYTTASNNFWYKAGEGSHNARLFGLTGTIDYSLWKNVISRLEVRWDHSLTGDRPFGNVSDEGPDALKNIVTVALNIIYKF